MRLAAFTLAGMLWILGYVILASLLLMLVNKIRRRSRLSYVRDNRLEQKMAKWVSRSPFFMRHLSDLLSAAGWRIRPASFSLVTMLLALSGMLAGALAFYSAKGIAALAIILGGMPYLYARMRLLTLQYKTRIDFLPAVEVFYQAYLLRGQRSVRAALQDCLTDNRLRYPVSPLFGKLFRQLSSGEEEEALRIFAMSFGHVWAQYFANMLRLGLTEGVDLSDGLKELIGDMRRAQLTDQTERNRLLEIRLANFSPLLFLVLFLIVNIKLNPRQAYLYYVLDPLGRSMLLDAILLIFVSFVMGVYLSMRKM